jgi:hypothetical protein
MATQIVQEGMNVGSQQQGLSWEGWLRREQLRGYESSPNTSEFSDLNDLSMAKNLHIDREIERFRDLLARNPQAWREFEASLLAPADTQALQQSTAAEAPVPGNCNTVPMEIAQPTNLICDPVNPIRYPASREERPGHANGRVTPNAGGAQEQVESQAAVHPEGIRPSLRQDNIIGGQIGQIFMFEEHPQCGRGVPIPVSEPAQGVARSANEGINQLEHTLNSQGRGRGESEGS